MRSNFNLTSTSWEESPKMAKRRRQRRRCQSLLTGVCQRDGCLIKKWKRVLTTEHLFDIIRMKFQIRCLYLFFRKTKKITVRRIMIMNTGPDRILKKQLCPNCSKRIFDICAQNSGHVIVELKCPHCKKIVTVDYQSPDMH